MDAALSAEAAVATDLVFTPEAALGLAAARPYQRLRKKSVPRVDFWGNLFGAIFGLIALCRPTDQPKKWVDRGG